MSSSFACRLLASQKSEVDALTREQFNEWDRARQQQYLQEHPDSDFHDSEGAGQEPANPEEEPAEQAPVPMPEDGGEAFPEAPTTFQVLNEAFGPLDKKLITALRTFVDMNLDKEQLGVAETNLRSLTTAYVTYVIQSLGSTNKAPAELEPETQQVLNTLAEALNQTKQQ